MRMTHLEQVLARATCTCTMDMTADPEMLEVTKMAGRADIMRRAAWQGRVELAQRKLSRFGEELRTLLEADCQRIVSMDYLRGD